ncbi:MAG: FtsH protease activity modulator HflK [Proteobacteria bacterium]|nr:FtsH protease activity modulator HflK [Pseudomonadota bacterium]MBU1709618.1 FtsH protease activity modulator HflK [Pseudomonadota bacterium]
MAWDDQKTPWDKKRPSSPEDLIAALIKKVKDAFDGGGQGGDGGVGGGSDNSGGGSPAGFMGDIKKVIAVVVAVLLLYGVYACFYKIETGWEGVVLRFGKYNRTASPGLNFKLPMIDTLIKVNVDNVRKEEFGFRTRTPGQKTVYEKKGYDMESLMLTGDKNVIDVEWIVQYKVMDPVNFIFKVRDVRQAVRDASEQAIRRIVGNQDFDYVLSNRVILEAATAKELQGVLDRYESGVYIMEVKLQDVNPPETVKPAFNEVNEADQDMKRLVNEAEETYNRVIPKARGSAKQTIEESYGYSVERVNRAKGETARFLDILKEYTAAKDVTRKRMYLETMVEVMPTLSEVYVIDEDQKSLLPLMDLTGKKAK